MEFENSLVTYQIGEGVIHPSYGGCIVDAITPKNIDGIPEDFYTLSPIINSNSNITVFVPVRLAAKIGLRPVISSKAAQDILSAIPGMETDWIKDSTLRKRTYTQIVKSDDLIELVRLIKSFAIKNSEQKISNADQPIFEFGKKRVISEFALSLEKTYDNMDAIFKNVIEKSISN